MRYYTSANGFNYFTTNLLTFKSIAMMYSKRTRFLFPLFFLAAIAFFSLLVMLIWNAVIPQIFGLSVISYVQALLLLLLTRILFSGSPFRHRHDHASFHEKMRKMSPEERDEFRKNWRSMRKAQWGCFPGKATETTEE